MSIKWLKVKRVALKLLLPFEMIKPTTHKSTVKVNNDVDNVKTQKRIQKKCSRHIFSHALFGVCTQPKRGNNLARFSYVLFKLLFGFFSYFLFFQFSISSSLPFRFPSLLFLSTVPTNCCLHLRLVCFPLSTQYSKKNTHPTWHLTVS